MNPTAVIALANLKRRRRSDTQPRAPLANLARARRALAEEGLPIAGLSRDQLPTLARLVDAVCELGDCLALARQPARRPVDVINEIASGCTATTRLSVVADGLERVVRWRDPDPVAGLARRIIEEFDSLDTSRIRQCERQQCDLLFVDPTRSRSQRWHAEDPCGWLERQHRRRTRDPQTRST